MSPSGPRLDESKAFFGFRIEQEAKGYGSPPGSDTWREFWEGRFDYVRTNRSPEYAIALIEYIRKKRAEKGLPPI